MPSRQTLADNLPGAVAAANMDSGAALLLCSLILEVITQMPQARGLIGETLRRGESGEPPADPAIRAAEMIALGRLRAAYDQPKAQAA